MDAAAVANTDKLGLTPWILKKLELDAPDMLVNYIVLLIGNDKSIPEITKELAELLGEDEARAFTSSLEIEMKRIKSAGSSSSASSSSSSSSAGAKRLLQTAMQPQRGAGDRGKRQLDDRTEQRDQESSFDPKRQRGTAGPSGPSGPAMGSMGSMGTAPLSQLAPAPMPMHGGGITEVSPANIFLAQMNMMAQAAGYRDADAMMVGILPCSPLFLHPSLHVLLGGASGDAPHLRYDTPI